MKKKLEKVLLPIFVMGIMLYPNMVLADAIVLTEDFYDIHSEGCEYVNRYYTANGPDGKVFAYESPESDKVIYEIQNGEKIQIDYIYKDKNGIEWGMYCKWEATWVPMDYLTVVYDHISFEEDYGDEFQIENGVVESEGTEVPVYFWNYPGSEEYRQGVIEIDIPLHYETVFTDTIGHKWAYVEDYRGNSEKWICIASPSADFSTLYPKGTWIEAVTEVQALDNIDDERIVHGEKKEINQNVIYTAGLFVAAVVIVSIILIRILWRNDRKNSSKK